MENGGLAGYLRMMTDMITKKRNALKEMLTLTEKQSELLKAETFDDELFDEIISQKEGLISEVNELDSGFQTMYNKIKENLEAEKDANKDLIITLQKLIQEVTELGALVIACEKRNQDSFAMVAGNVRKNVKNFKVSRNTASNYYKTMTGLHAAGPAFMDEKQ